MSKIEVTHNPGRSRYEAHLDGELAGTAEYELSDGVITFTHTVVDPSFEGRGVASALARTALDEVRAAGEPPRRAAVLLHQGVDREAPGLSGPARRSDLLSGSGSVVS